MSLYAVIVFVHVASALGLFIAFGLEWFCVSGFRRSKSADQLRTWTGISARVPAIFGSSLGVLLISGGYLSAKLGSMAQQGWVLVTLGVIVVVAVIGGAIGPRRVRPIRQAANEASGPLPADLRSRLTDPWLTASIRVRFVLALGIVFLMCTRLPILASTVAMAAWFLAGVIFAGFAWRRAAA